MRLFPVLAFTATWALACGGLSSTKSTGSYGDENLDTADNGNSDTGGSGSSSGGSSSGGSSSGGSSSGGSSSGGGSAATDDDRDGFTEDDGDCNDRSTAVYPGAAETCNGRDDNCDGTIDEGACNDTGGGSSSGGSSSGGTGTDTGWGGGGGGYGGYGTYGLAQQFFVGRLNVSGTTYSSGNLGMAFYGVTSGATICDFRGDLTSLGRATQASSCTGCTWSFDLSPITSSRQQSGDCAAVSLSAGAFDTYFDYEWGFANSWDFYGDGSIMVDETVVLNSLDGSGWFPFAFNASAYGISQVTATRSRVDFLRPAFDSYGSYAYTYYYL